MFRVVIPARHASARLAGKVLRPIGGKPMLQWVYERACAAGAREVLIASDDERIVSAARAFGAEAVLTASTHASGTDRIAEVAGARPVFQPRADSLESRQRVRGPCQSARLRRRAPPRRHLRVPRGRAAAPGA